MSEPASLVLASTSPQRRAILEQLRIPFTAVVPDYVEHDPPDADPVELVREHALGKARSVRVDGRWTLGVDTTVHLGGRVYGKADSADAAVAMLTALAGRTHDVVSGLCLLGPGLEQVESVTTHVTFRTLAEPAIRAYVAAGEWEGRAGAYAIQGLGARLVERIDGDYLNVVGLPAARLVELLERHAPGLLRRDRHQPREEQQPFPIEPRALALRPGVDADKAAESAARLEDEEAIGGSGFGTDTSRSADKIPSRSSSLRRSDSTA
ncbi:MAG: Maf family protein [Gaiellales bacterium]